MDSPLPAQYQWASDRFVDLAQYITQQAEAFALAVPGSKFTVAPSVASYSNLQQRTQCIRNAALEDRADYEAGVAVGTVTRYYPATAGGIGIVSSQMQNAAVSSATGANDWHAVVVLRHKGTVWVFDPAYVMGTKDRLPLIVGCATVCKLITHSGFGKVTQVLVQGIGSQKADCMGRSAQWLDTVIGAPNFADPFAAGSIYVAGQQTPGWDVVQKS